jgi:crotonobetainyl-CoA:carnitine CoA-transferase CaiB-like acyl-CoA transferase
LREKVEAEREKKGLLSGMRVLDLSDEKGSFCSKLLADMGADVIKIEEPGGNSSRMIGPFRGGTPHPERSLSFAYANTNKRGITLNLENSEGKELFVRLIKRADILVESYPPGYLDTIALGFDVLGGINSRLIMASITGFGQTGPRRDLKSCDLVASALGGQVYVSGSPSSPPLKPYGEQSHLTGSLFAALGILLALRRRRRDGTGGHIDISLQESVVSTLEHVMVRYFHEDIISKRQGNRHWNDFFCILECKDGFIHLTPFQYWETLIEWLEREGMAKDLLEEKWGDPVYRLDHADYILAVLEEWTKTHTQEELFELGQLMRFPWAPVYSPEEVLSSPQLKARGYFHDIRELESGPVLKYGGLPFKSSEKFSVPFKKAPMIGEDNRKVYGKELGLSEEDMAAFSSRRVI